MFAKPRISSGAASSARVEDQLGGILQRVSTIAAGLGLDLNQIVQASRTALDEGRAKSRKMVLKDELHGILRHVSTIAAGQGLEVDHIGVKEIPKLEGRRKKAEKWEHLDTGYPPDERIPRRFKVQFTKRPIAHGESVIRISLNGVTFGDSFKNSHDKYDSYGFHDAFHLTYAAVLGWSPVTRAMLRRKRLTNPTITEREDGPQAIVIEEAIALFIYRIAKERDLFAGQTRVDADILRIAKRLTAGLEVRRSSLYDWEDAVLQGCAAYRQLVRHNGGVLVMSLDERAVVYKKA